MATGAYPPDAAYDPPLRDDPLLSPGFGGAHSDAVLGGLPGGDILFAGPPSSLDTPAPYAPGIPAPLPAEGTSLQPIPSDQPGFRVQAEGTSRQPTPSDQPTFREHSYGAPPPFVPPPMPPLLRVPHPYATHIEAPISAPIKEPGAWMRRRRRSNTLAKVVVAAFAVLVLIQLGGLVARVVFERAESPSPSVGVVTPSASPVVGAREIEVVVDSPTAGVATVDVIVDGEVVASSEESLPYTYTATPANYTTVSVVARINPAPDNGADLSCHMRVGGEIVDRARGTYVANCFHFRDR